eukprot:2606413-Karenia_brevis.AAC.1
MWAQQAAAEAAQPAAPQRAGSGQGPSPQGQAHAHTLMGSVLERARRSAEAMRHNQPSRKILPK